MMKAYSSQDCRGIQILSIESRLTGMEGHVEPAKTLRAVNAIDLGGSYMKYRISFCVKKNHDATREVTRFLCNFFVLARVINIARAKSKASINKFII